MNVGFQIALTAALVLLALVVTAALEEAADNKFPEWLRRILGVLVIVALVAFFGGAVAGVWLI